MKRCNTCGKRYHISHFYKIAPNRASRTPDCKYCINAARRATRRQKHIKGEYWLQDASGNKRALPFDVVFKAGSRWVKEQHTHLFVVNLHETVLRRSNNHKAAKVLRYHRQSLPTCLPYTIVITGTEWPIIAHAYHSVMRHASTEELRKRVRNVYQRLVKARRKAADEHNAESDSGDGGG